ncbi:MAG TPA: amidohydrolase [Thermoanaerobaculia bacterium]|nr:amidohydrolase [Thermoanaerobaculia bacterium]
MNGNVDDALKAFPERELERLIAVRRDLHRHPELGFEETRTAGMVRDRLAETRLVPSVGIGRTGVVADLGEEGAARVMIRADMDALPLEEETGVPYVSSVPGKMHACGHDGHVAIGLAVAERLARDPAGGAFRSLFQPAEEGAGGARAMVDDGALDGVSAALGLHLWNPLPVGKIGLVSGPQMAAVDEFEIVVRGPGGHGAAPHETFDAVLASARIVESLQTIVAREISPLDPAVVTVGAIHGGTAFNIIPREVRMKGTARSFSPEAHAALPGKIARIAEGVARACGVTAEIDYRRINEATVNDRSIAELVAEAAEEILGAGSVVETRTMGGEDMSVYLARVPGCFFFVGSGLPGAYRPHHSPVFDFDERALAVGTLLLEACARRLSERLRG